MFIIFAEIRNYDFRRNHSLIMIQIVILRVTKTHNNTFWNLFGKIFSKKLLQLNGTQEYHSESLGVKKKVLVPNFVASSSMVCYIWCGGCPRGKFQLCPCII